MMTLKSAWAMYWLVLKFSALISLRERWNVSSSADCSAEWASVIGRAPSCRSRAKASGCRLAVTPGGRHSGL